MFMALDEYLTGGQTHIGASEVTWEPENPPAEAEPEPDQGAEPFGPNDDIAEIAFQHARRLNGTRPNERDITMHAGETGGDEEGDEDMESEDESPSTRRRRYLNNTMDEVSDPDEWATIHYGDREPFDYDRMVAFSQANQQRLSNALHTLLFRRQNAEAAGNYDEVDAYDRAINEVQNLRDIA
eukprot:s1251_g10.t1